jgi:hypothetical protein
MLIINKKTYFFIKVLILNIHEWNGGSPSFIYILILILREIILFLLILVLIVQTSSLWRRIIIIPIRIIVVILIRASNSFRGILIIIYILIFISGLLVLIVSVSSVSPSEQDYTSRKLLIIISLIVSIPLGMEYKSSYNYYNLILSISWFEHQAGLYIFILILLLVSLAVLTYLLQNFKGLTRRI